MWMSYMNSKDYREVSSSEQKKLRGRATSSELRVARPIVRYRTIGLEARCSSLATGIKCSNFFLTNYHYTKNCCAINTAAPARYPSNATHPIFLTYQKKSIFSSPMAATPAAEPIIRILPPVPAQKARNSQ